MSTTLRNSSISKRAIIRSQLGGRKSSAAKRTVRTSTVISKGYSSTDESNNSSPRSTGLQPATLANDQIKSQDSMVGECLPSACSADDKKSLSQSLQVLIDLAETYGFREEGYDRRHTLLHWQICSAECGWVKFLKYKLAAYMSFYLDNEIPEKPFLHEDKPNQIAGGSLGRFMQLVCKGPLSYSFRTSILQVKKGLPRPGKKAVEKAVKDTKEVLTTIHPPPPSEYSSRERIFAEARRTVREAFCKKITTKDLLKPYTPSIRANYTDSRSSFGTLGTLMEMGLMVDHDTPKEIYDRAVIKDEEEKISDVQQFKINPEFKSGVERIYECVYSAVREKAQEEIADVTLVGLEEALKVRVISKGPALTYFTLRPVQKFLHKILRKIPCFVLLGEPKVTLEHLERFKTEIGNFQSLDYQSATDLLDPEFSRCIGEEICDAVEMPEDLRKLFIKALTGHSIEGTEQKWGQLMGSIVSFIVLCLANATVVRHSLEIVNKRSYTLYNCPMLINGDDGLVRSSDDYLPVWKSIAGSIGLKPSAGKVYSHSEYLNINSTSFVFNGKNFEHIPYVNMGLVTGQKRSNSVKSSQDVFDGDDGSTLGAKHRELMNSCPPELQLAVHEQFLKYNSETLKSLHGIPWYVPELLGGVGLFPLVNYKFPEEGYLEDVIRSYKITSTGHKCGPTKVDVMIAYAIKDKRFDKSLRVGKVKTSQPIQARPVWSSVVNRKTESGALDSNEEAFLDLSTFYTNPSEVAVVLDDKARLETLRRNERVWSHLHKVLEIKPDHKKDYFL